jgi:hypothetical protein
MMFCVLLLPAAACSDCCVTLSQFLKAGITVIVTQFAVFLVNTLTL